MRLTLVLTEPRSFLRASVVHTSPKWRRRQLAEDGQACASSRIRVSAAVARRKLDRCALEKSLIAGGRCIRQQEANRETCSGLRLVWRFRFCVPPLAVRARRGCFPYAGLKIRRPCSSILVEYQPSDRTDGFSIGPRCRNLRCDCLLVDIAQWWSLFSNQSATSVRWLAFRVWKIESGPSPLCRPARRPHR